MRAFRDSAGLTMAVALERRDDPAEDEAEVIDLLQLPPSTRPTPFASLEYDEVGRCRTIDCESYDQCLSFAARLRWPSFHCRQCPRYAGKTQELELARAREAAGAPDARIIKLR